LLWLAFLVACQSSLATPFQPLHITATVIETVVPSSSPTLTVVPSATVVPSSTPTVDELIFPYTIDGLRQHEFQSGEIHVREILADTEKYTAYLIDYPSDGLTITGVMQIPNGDGPFPVIVMNHGFFSRYIYNSGDGTDRASAFLAEHGYITLASDYRSWGESDTALSFFYSGLVIDVINLMNAIPSIPQADPERIGMWGHSMGGGVTIKVLAIDPRIKAGVLYSTVSADDADIIGRWGIGCFGDVLQGEQVFGCNSSDIIPSDLPLALQTAYHNTASNSDELQKVAAYYHLGYVTAPIQIHYGDKDGVELNGTPPQWSVKLTQALRDAGKDVEMYGYENQGHSFVGEPWFVFMRRVLWFFDAELK